MGASQSTQITKLNEKAPLTSTPVHVERASDLLARFHIDKATEDSGVLSISSFDQWEQALEADPAKRLARTVLSKQHIWTALQSREAAIADQQVFNLKVCSFDQYCLPCVLIVAGYSYRDLLARCATKWLLDDAGSSRRAISLEWL